MEEYAVEGLRNEENRFRAPVEAESELQARINFLLDVGVIDAGELEEVRDARDYEVEEFLEKQERKSEFRVQGVKSANL